MGQIFVKSHRRGSSVVRAYQRAGQVISRIDKRLYGKRTVSAGRAKQLRMLSSRLSSKQAQMGQILEGKLRTGAGLLGVRNYKQTKRFNTF